MRRNVQIAPCTLYLGLRKDGLPVAVCGVRMAVVFVGDILTMEAGKSTCSVVTSTSGSSLYAAHSGGCTTLYGVFLVS